MNFNQTIHTILNKIGFDLIRYHPESHPLARRKWLLDKYQIDIVLDVGANKGQYGTELIRIGYTGDIVSFEPLSEAYAILTERADQHEKWVALHYALGSKNYTTEINVAQNSHSSSIRGILPAHLKSAPDSKYIGVEQIEVKTLDTIFNSFCTKEQTVYLKIDTQGFEKEVLIGAEASLPYINTIQLEMTFIDLYENETLFNEMYQLMMDNGYQVVAIEKGFADVSSGKILQADMIFHRF